jgi:hypothetical protein
MFEEKNNINLKMIIFLNRYSKYNKNMKKTHLIIKLI